MDDLGLGTFFFITFSGFDVMGGHVNPWSFTLDQPLTNTPM